MLISLIRTSWLICSSRTSLVISSCRLGAAASQIPVINHLSSSARHTHTRAYNACARGVTDVLCTPASNRGAVGGAPAQFEQVCPAVHTR